MVEKTWIFKDNGRSKKTGREKKVVMVWENVDRKHKEGRATVVQQYQNRKTVKMDDINTNWILCSVVFKKDETPSVRWIEVYKGEVFISQNNSTIDGPLADIVIISFDHVKEILAALEEKGLV
jgi:hypothetical protein